MSSARAAPLAVAGATLAVSVSAILVAEAKTDAATVVWLRMGMAVVLLVPWTAGHLRPSARPAAREVTLTLLAGACLAVHFLAWTASLAYTTVAASVLLVSLHPLLVTPLGARLHGDRVGRRLVLGIVLALAGVVVTCAPGIGGGGETLRGDLLALLGAVALAAYLLIGRGRRAGSVSVYSAAAYAVVSAAAVIVAAATGTLHAPGGRTVLSCLGLAAICTIGGHTVFNWALRRLPASTVSLSLLGEPPLAAALALVILGQRPTTATVLGGCLILAGLAVTLVTTGVTRRGPGDVVVATD